MPKKTDSEKKPRKPKARRFGLYTKSAIGSLVLVTVEQFPSYRAAERALRDCAQPDVDYVIADETPVRFTSCTTVVLKRV